MKVAIGPSSFGQADEAPLHLLSEHGVEIVPNPVGRRLGHHEIRSLLEGVDGLIAGLEPLDREVLLGSSSLKAIARVGVGLDTVDLAAAEDLGIRVSNTPSAPAAAVAEMTVAAMILLSRSALVSSEALHAGRWEKKIGRSLSESMVLIVGFGRIGRAVRRHLHGFGATVLVNDPLMRSEDEPGDEFVDLAEGLSKADIVTLHASGSRVILDGVAFSRMKRGTVVLNSGRGEQVDERALVAALDDGTVAGAWLDVFHREPYDGPLRSYPQVILTPHMATYTRETRRAMELEAVENLLRDLGLSRDH